MCIGNSQLSRSELLTSCTFSEGSNLITGPWLTPDYDEHMLFFWESEDLVTEPYLKKKKQPLDS